MDKSAIAALMDHYEKHDPKCGECLRLFNALGQKTEEVHLGAGGMDRGFHVVHNVPDGVTYDRDVYSITVCDRDKSWRMAVEKDFADGDMGSLDWNKLMTLALEQLR